MTQRFLDPPMPDVAAQWERYFKLLAPRPGQAVLDLGCDRGDALCLLLARQPLLRRAVGLDAGKARLAAAIALAERLALQQRPEFVQGDGRRLPFGGGAFDRVYCADTLEWITPAPDALHEVLRVLAPDGQALLVHSDFDSQVFAGSDPALSRAVVHAFNDAGPAPFIARELPSLARQAGFSRVEPQVYTLVSESYAADGYPHAMVALMRDWLTRTGCLPATMLDTWETGLQAAAAQGRFFYSVNRVLCLCRP